MPEHRLASSRYGQVRGQSSPFITVLWLRQICLSSTSRFVAGPVTPSGWVSGERYGSRSPAACCVPAPATTQSVFRFAELGAYRSEHVPLRLGRLERAPRPPSILLCCWQVAQVAPRGRNRRDALLGLQDRHRRSHGPNHPGRNSLASSPSATATPIHSAWPGQSILESAQPGVAELKDALVTEGQQREDRLLWLFNAGQRTRMRAVLDGQWKPLSVPPTAAADADGSTEESGGGQTPPLFQGAV